METNQRIEKLREMMEAVSRVRQFIHDEIAAVDPAGVADISDPPPQSAPPAAGGMGRRGGKLPEFVERRGDKFGCNIQRKGLNLRKGGFKTPQAAQGYAVEQIEKHGGEKTLSGRRGSDRPQTPAEMKAAVKESRQRTERAKRKWVECVGCGYELGVPGDKDLPTPCPKCGDIGQIEMDCRWQVGSGGGQGIVDLRL